jgi:hypothetical protein
MNAIKAIKINGIKTNTHETDVYPLEHKKFNKYNQANIQITLIKRIFIWTSE